MQIHELSRLTGVKPETIRSYRLKGLLQPVQMENGYYDYTAADYVSLVYIRKMRAYSFTIEDISKLYSNHTSEDIYQMIVREQERIRQQISVLEEQVRYLEFEKKHVEESIQISKDTLLIRSLDEKVDFYNISSLAESSDFGILEKMYSQMTPTLRISRDVLNNPPEQEYIPIQIGIGSYRHILDQMQIRIPEDAIHIPDGRYISQMVQISDLHEISRSQLEPMFRYGKKSGQPYLSDTTGYLVNIENRDGKLYFRFRIRACIGIENK